CCRRCSGSPSWPTTTPRQPTASASSKPASPTWKPNWPRSGPCTGRPWKNSGNSTPTAAAGKRGLPLDLSKARNSLTGPLSPAKRRGNGWGPVQKKAPIQRSGPGLNASVSEKANERQAVAEIGLFGFPGIDLLIAVRIDPKGDDAVQLELVH